MRNFRLRQPIHLQISAYKRKSCSHRSTLHNQLCVSKKRNDKLVIISTLRAKQFHKQKPCNKEKMNQEHAMMLYDSQQVRSAPHQLSIKMNIQTSLISLLFFFKLVRTRNKTGKKIWYQNSTAKIRSVKNAERDAFG